jgi:hypothetical protein
MARRTKREEKPPESNRGRPNARGVFIVFDLAADEPLMRSGGASDERPAPEGSQGEVHVEEERTQVENLA